MNKVKVANLVIGILLFIPTIVNVSNVFYIVFLVIGGYEFLKSHKTKSGFITALSLVTLVTAVIFYLTLMINPEYQERINVIQDFLPLPLSILACFYFVHSRYVNPSVFRIISVFISIEILIGILQYFLGIRYFIQPSVIYLNNEMGDSDFLYNFRVFGLSSNSSVLALKSFCLLLIGYYLQISKKWKFIFFLLGLTGLFITFNRTAMAASLFFLFLISIQILKEYKYAWILLMIMMIAAVGLIVPIAEDIFYQLNRGKDSADLSGRDFIFSEFWEFFLKNPLFGNNFHTLRIAFNDGFSHAHNSYLQLLAQTGILFFTVIIFVIGKHITKRNYFYIFPILIYSLAQYGIFWGISFLDVVFFYFLSNSAYRNVQKIQTP